MQFRTESLEEQQPDIALFPVMGKNHPFTDRFSSYWGIPIYGNPPEKGPIDSSPFRKIKNHREQNHVNMQFRTESLEEQQPDIALFPALP